ncbi:MAG: YbhB/YbcL family Raf kinase inhibitor-like protein [Candidatus Pacearchaeota archaeon]|nr:YbhB/YbcL family Raf kinase inhibitor-like protein [Candidatus Pacearchaeota archaeon]MDE1848807.1 YbhB/YbcL family Raf kinase inhibitor-like protein [Nanoarchaeota archaeon]
MEIRSIFRDGERIPERYTCDGDNVNPLLEFSGVPSEAKSLVLVIDDPDSPSRNFVHWVMWNIPANTKRINEDSAPRGARQGRNDFGNLGYGGPCPHEGNHRYRFRLFALDILLDLQNGSKADVEMSMKEHILAQTVLTGTYSR